MQGTGLQEFESLEAVGLWVCDGPYYNCSWLAIGRIDEFIFVWEDNGWTGSERDVAIALSTAGSFTSVFWNVNSVMRFVHARGGTLLRSFDPLLRGDDRSPAEIDGLPIEEEAGLDWKAAPVMSALEVLARLTTGHSPTPALLDLPGLRFFGRQFWQPAACKVRPQLLSATARDRRASASGLTRVYVSTEDPRTRRRAFTCRRVDGQMLGVRTSEPVRQPRRAWPGAAAARRRGASCRRCAWRLLSRRTPWHRR